MNKDIKTLISTLTPTRKTFEVVINKINSGETVHNALFNHYVKTASNPNYIGYKSFVKECVMLSQSEGKRAFEVVNRVTTDN